MSKKWDFTKLIDDEFEDMVTEKQLIPNGCGFKHIPSCGSLENCKRTLDSTTLHCTSTTEEEYKGSSFDFLSLLPPIMDCDVTCFEGKSTIHLEFLEGALTHNAKSTEIALQVFKSF
ncbi:hypothetical protein STEG23_012560 [Scotinomys teguina]